jgi:hypothetical protein
MEVQGAVSKGELWSPRKLLRRAIWHERDHTEHILKINEPVNWRLDIGDPRRLAGDDLAQVTIIGYNLDDFSHIYKVYVDGA